MSVLDAIVCIVAAVILVPMAFLPLLVESGKKSGIVKTGQSGDDHEA